MLWGAKCSGSFKRAAGSSETLWAFPKRLWEAQKRSGSFKNALGGSETLWELQNGFGRLSNALRVSKSFGRLRNVPGF